MTIATDTPTTTERPAFKVADLALHEQGRNENGQERRPDRAGVTEVICNHEEQ